jgi:hypothetical protein
MRVFLTGEWARAWRIFVVPSENIRLSSGEQDEGGVREIVLEDREKARSLACDHRGAFGNPAAERVP